MNQNENRSSPSLVTSPNQNPNRRLTSGPESPNHRRYGTSTGSNGKSRTKSEHKRRRTTGSVNGHAEGEYFPDEQGEYYSGLEDSSDGGSGSDSGDESGSGLEDLDLGEDDIPVTGFAVASNKRNADFHELFPGIPEGDYLIDDYGCALQREILIQGRIYVSENHLCFHANIFGWVTDLSIPIYEITTLEKRMTAFVIPNAIRVKTNRADHTFASFLSRDTTFDVIHNIWRLARPGDAGSIGSGSMEGAVNIAEGTVIGGGAAGSVAPKAHKATTCACGKQGSHFTQIALDTVVPGTPDRIYNLMFASGFMKDFMAVNQKLFDIQVSDWAPVSAGSQLLTRNMSYIKPLYASLGPKQTKCEIRDETVHIDFDDYVSTLTTTRTPDVPSGGVFSVKTRTCFMWASPLTTRILVTTQVDWTGRSFIKGIIEKSCIDGQKEYHADLDKAMRVYISDHQSEFMPEGVEVVLPDPTPDAAPATPGVTGEPISAQQRQQERKGRGMQWAWDTFAGAAQVAKQSTKGALELLHDSWENANMTTVLYLLIIGLVISNLWTYMAMDKKQNKAKKKLAKVEDKEQFLAGVVTALFDEFASNKLGAMTSAAAPALAPTAVPPPAAAVTGVPSGADLNLELAAIHGALDTVEERVRMIRENLKEVGSLNNVD
ncbi:GRAM domain-containing protein [Mycena galopus ATCC 62051]|nr:GRAM domain-containing protein [Mycena galopus ATCC 62051]